MRLLDTGTGQFVDLTNAQAVKHGYAILSHTWNTTNGEQTYQELKEVQKSYRVVGIRPPFPGSSVNLSTDRPKSRPVTSSTPEDSVTPSSPSSSSPSSQNSHPEGGGVAPEVDSSQPNTTSIWDDPWLSLKVRRACQTARAHGYRYIWIDSCCIDKTSSSELTEAINSMFNYYSHALVCIREIPP